MRQLVYDWDMQLIMNDEQIQTIEQVKEFLEGSEALGFRGLCVEEKYKWTETALVKFNYNGLKYKQTGRLKRTEYRRHRFTATKPVVSRIGERAKPDPRGQPGYSE